MWGQVISMADLSLSQWLATIGLLACLVGAWIMFTSKLDGIDCGTFIDPKIKIFQGRRAKIGLGLITGGTFLQISAVMLV